jgi:hypothetical protein
MTTKSPLVQLKPELLRAVDEACERIAGQHLAPMAVRDLLWEAAKKHGYKAYRVHLPDGVNLRETKVAKTLVAWAKKESLTLEWESRESTTPDGRRVTVYEPEISW